MNRFDKDYVKLQETEPTKWQCMELAWAMKELAEAMSERSAWDAFRHIDAAQRHMREFKGHFIEKPTLNEQEANIASALHTYMRKCMNSPLGTMLYRMICEDRGTPVWYAFVKGLVANKRSYREAIEAADGCYRTDQTTDNLFMLEALRLWEDDNFPGAHEWLQMCGK